LSVVPAPAEALEVDHYREVKEVRIVPRIGGLWHNMEYPKASFPNI